MTTLSPDMEISEELVRKFDKLGPRYTSYPTADRFHTAFTEQTYRSYLDLRAGKANNPPLSIYIHLPFCESLCYFCACNKIITKDHERVGEYLRYLDKEMALVASRLGKDRKTVQLHLGGGTPTFFNADELRQLMAMVRNHFEFTPDAELGVEIDPRTVQAGTLTMLAELGFNRNSFGVQDFDPAVQQAVNRIQPLSMVEKAVVESRKANFQSINADLIYGLPKQTPDSFDRTLAQVAELRPDRIALYAYAHLPERFKPQRRIVWADLPMASAKVSMLSRSLEAFSAAGYVYVGMDHFALPEDALAIAKRQGRLHRNFQGYSTQPDCDLIALGVSAIGRVGATYSQNAKTLDDYYDRLNQGHLPVVRGLALTRDDLVRRAVIMALMCQGELLFEPMEQSWLIDFRTYFAPELEQLKEMAVQGLVVMGPDGVEVTDMGWYFVRGIAMVFDRYLQADKNRARFSRII